MLSRNIYGLQGCSNGILAHRLCRPRPVPMLVPASSSATLTRELTTAAHKHPFFWVPFQRCRSIRSVFASAKRGSNIDNPVHTTYKTTPIAITHPEAAAFRHSPAVITITGAVALILIAADIFLPGSPHLLAPLDTAVATWVETNRPVSEDTRLLSKLLSNVPITIASVGIGVASLASGVQRPKATLQRLCAIITVLNAPGWTLTTKDFPVVDVIKNIIKRNRPAFGLEHSTTFSFPSGHTFCCLFFLGAMIIIASTSGKAAYDVKPAAAVTTAITRNRTPLLCLAAITAIGRVLSDVHWLSDTMAGAATATMMLGITSMLLQALDKQRIDSINN